MPRAQQPYDDDIYAAVRRMRTLPEEEDLSALVEPLDGSAMERRSPLTPAAGGSVYELVKERILSERQRADPEADAEKALRSAQDGANLATLNANLGQAGATIGAAFGGQKVDPSFYDSLRKNAGSGVKDAEGTFERVKQRILEERGLARQATMDERDRRDFTAEEQRFNLGRQDAASARSAAAAEAEKGRDFTAGENQKNREAQAREAARNRAAAKEAAQSKASIPDPKIPMDLRKEFNALPEVKAFKDVSVSYDKIRRVAANPSPAGDIAMVFSFMKMMDPGSTVREGEFATAQNAAGVPTQVVNAYNKALEGTRLAPEQRNDFLKQAERFYGAHEGPYLQAVEQYRGLAGRFGASPDDVASPPRTAQPQPMTGNVSLEQPPQQQAKTPVRVVPSKDRQWVKVVYSDGTEEVQRAGTN